MRHTVYACVLSVLLSAFVIVQASIGSAEPAPDSPAPVPTEDYPLYDLIVDEKFLTPETKLVLLDRATVTRLHPEQQGPLRIQTFNEYEIFDGRLPPAPPGFDYDSLVRGTDWFQRWQLFDGVYTPGTVSVSATNTGWCGRPS